MIVRDVFLIVFFVPCVLSILLAYIGAKAKGDSLRSSCVMTSILFFWAGLGLASDLSFRAWQSIPDPPPEAFNDAGAAGAMFFGWIPAIFFTLIVYQITKAFDKKRDTVIQGH